MEDLETIDFETRTTGSFSSSRGSTPPGTARESKHERTRSKDDTWVDILVQSNSRRIGGQDATMSTAQRRRTADPVAMSAAVGNLDLNDGEQRQGGIFEYDHSHDPIHIDDEYEEGGRRGLSRDDDDDDEDIQEIDYAPPKHKAAMFQQNQLHPNVQGDIGDNSSDDETVEHFPPVPSTSKRDQSEGSYMHKDTNRSHLPSSPSPAHKSGGGQGGVSALIEKYASLGTSGSGSPSPSRLPVRSTSLAKESKELPIPGSSLSPTHAGAKDAPLPRTPTTEDEPDVATHDFPRPLSGDLTPTQTPSRSHNQSPDLEPPSAPSPTPRYIHGAPLHNLPEDPEEEEV